MLGLTNEEMHEIFAEWNQGELDSYLIEITKEIFAKYDPETGKPMVDVILDSAGQKGTGKWTSQSALDLGVPLSIITESVFARFLSAMKQERVAASKLLKGPEGGRSRGTRRRSSNRCARRCTRARSAPTRKASPKCASVRRSTAGICGCGDIAHDLPRRLHHSRAVPAKIKEAYTATRTSATCCWTSISKRVVENYQDAWREVVATAVTHGIPVPAFASALAYYDSYRSERLPANLLQAQRDYFGAHTFQRVDKEGTFHFDWLNN